MDKNRYKLFRFFLIFLVLVLSLLPFAVAQSNKNEFKDSSSEKSLVNLFDENHDRNIGSVTSAVSEFINACCNSRDIAVQLLQKNRFHLTFTTDAKKVTVLNKQWSSEKESYDEFIYGKRGPSFWRFWDIFATYEIVLFIKDKKVERVWARIDRTLP